MPTHVIELPATVSQNEKAQASGHSAIPQMPGKWLINKQLLAVNDKRESTVASNPETIHASGKTGRNAAVVYTVTNL